MQWIEKWPNHWLASCYIGEESLCISVFKHRAIGGEGLSRWIVCVESPVVGGRWPLSDRNLTPEQAQSEALKIADAALDGAMEWIHQAKTSTWVRQAKEAITPQ